MLLLTHDKSFDPTNYYEVLGVQKNATKRELHKAFRRLSKLHHPDKGGNPEQFRLLQEAYENLSDDSKRFVYDTLGFDKRDLDAAVAMLVEFIIMSFQQGHKTENKLKPFIRQLLKPNKDKVVQNIKTAAGISSTLQSMLQELTPGNYIMNLTITRTQEHLRGVARDIEDMQKQLKLLDAVDVLLQHVNMKTKNYENWGFASNYSTFTMPVQKGFMWTTTHA